MDFHRELTTTELLYDELRQREVSANLAVACRLDHALEPAQVRAALAKVQARHPMLNVRIVRMLDPQLTSQGVGEIPLEVRRRRDDAQVHELLEAELNRPLDPIAGPLARAHLLAGAERSELVFVWDHGIGDGFSGRVALRDWLRSIAEPARVVEPTARRPPMDELLPERAFAEGLRHRLAVRAIAGLEAASPSIERALARVPAGVAARLPTVARGPEARTRVLVRELEGAALEALRERARARKLNLASALAAALALALVRARGRAPTHHVLVSNAVTLRPRFGVGDEFGNYAYGPLVPVWARPRAELWPLAQRLGAKLERAAGPAMLDDARELIDLTYRSLALAERAWVARATKLVNPRHVLVSNLGRLEHEPAWDPLRVRRVWLAAAVTHIDLGLTAFGHRDALTLCFNYPAPQTEPALAAAVADATLESLRAS